MPLLDPVTSPVDFASAILTLFVGRRSGSRFSVCNRRFSSDECSTFSRSR